MAKFKVEFEVDDIVVQVLRDDHSGYLIDEEYIIEHGLEMEEMDTLREYMEGGFYKHYPLSPTPLGYFVWGLIKDQL